MPSEERRTTDNTQCTVGGTERLSAASSGSDIDMAASDTMELCREGGHGQNHWGLAVFFRLLLFVEEHDFIFAFYEFKNNHILFKKLDILII